MIFNPGLKLTPPPPPPPLSSSISSSPLPHSSVQQRSRILIQEEPSYGFETDDDDTAESCGLSSSKTRQFFILQKTLQRVEEGIRLPTGCSLGLRTHWDSSPTKEGTITCRVSHCNAKQGNYTLITLVPQSPGFLLLL